MKAADVAVVAFRTALLVIASLTALPSVRAQQPNKTADFQVRTVLVLSPELRGRAGGLSDGLRVLGGLARPGDGVAAVEVGSHPTTVLPMTQVEVGQDHRIEAALARWATKKRPEGSNQPALLGSLNAALHLLGPRQEDTQDIVWVLPGPSEFSMPPTAGFLQRLEQLVADAQVRELVVQVLVADGLDDDGRFEPLATKTGGAVRRWGAELSLARTILELTTRIAQTDTIPVRGGALWVDEHVDLLTLMMAHEPKEVLTVVRPDEARIRPGTRTVRWHQLGSVHLVHFPSPMPGQWQIEQSAGLDRAVAVVRSSHLHLVAEAEPKVATVDAPVELRARILEGGRPLLSYARLSRTDMTGQLHLPSGSTVELEFRRKADGWFASTWNPPEDGRVKLVVEARSPEIDRRHAFEFDVDQQCFQPQVSWEPGRVNVEVGQDPKCRGLSEVQAWVQLSSDASEEEPVWFLLSSVQDGRYAGSLDVDGPGALRIRVRALQGHRTRGFMFDPIRTPPNAEGDGWLSIVAQLIVANLPLSLFGLVFVFRRQLSNLEEPARV